MSEETLQGIIDRDIDDYFEPTVSEGEESSAMLASLLSDLRLASAVLDSDQPSEQSVTQPVDQTEPEDQPAAMQGEEAPAEPEQMRAREIEELRERFTELTGEDLERVQFLQQTLSNLATLFVDVERAGVPGKEAEDRQKLLDAVRELKEKLQLESEAKVFGTATQNALKQYVEWLQKKAIPEAIKEMDSLQLALPPGCPIDLPSDRYQRSINPELYRALSSNNELELQLAIQADKIPAEQTMAKLASVYEWLVKCNDAATEARGEHQDRILSKLIKEMGLPGGWERRPEENPVTWRASAAEMIDLSTRMRNYIEAMQSLYKASRNGDFPMELPRGTTLVVEHNGQTYEITDKDIADSAKKRLLKDGSLKQIKLDLPPDLRQDNPANQQKIERLREWIARHGERIDQAVTELIELEKNPTAVIMYGDQEIRNGKGRFDQNGNFLGLVDPRRYEPQPGETLKDVNLLGYDFQVEEIKDGPNKGKFKVTQTVTAENAPWYAYQNWRALGIEKLGTMPVDEKILGPDDFVPVRNGDKIELVKAKNLSSFKTMQQGWYWGEKVLITTMDAAMLVSGTIEIGAAVRGARLAAAGATAGLRLTGGQAAWEIAKGATRVTVAGAGIFNNAGGRALMWGDWRVGEFINTARGIYFLTDISLGLGKGAWGWLRAGKAGESLSAAEKVHTIIHGRKALEGAEALKGIPFVSKVHTGTTWAFKACELGFAPVIIAELNHQWHKLHDLGKRDPATDAVIQVGDGRGLQAAERGSFDPNNAKAVEGARAVLDGYAAVLKDGRSDEIQTNVQQIIDRTKELLGPDANADDKQAFAESLLAQISFTGENIRDLELAHPQSQSDEHFRLTDQQLHDLRDPEKRRHYPKPVQELAERILAGKSADVEAAARIALLYLSRDGDGKIAEKLAEIRATVPEYTKQIIEYVDGPDGPVPVTRRVTVRSRQATETISAADAVADLKRDLESKTLGNRGIVIGEALTRIGAITHQQYGGILQDVLRSEQSSKQDKLRALSDAYGARFATIIDGVRYQESLPVGDMTAVDRQRLQGRQFGLSSKDLIATLSTVAKTDKDADVRAMAAAQLYGLYEKDPARRAELLSGLNNLAQEHAGKAEGELARAITDLLLKEMQTRIPENASAADFVKERRLNAAASLSMIVPETNEQVQKAINKAIADSFSSSNPLVTVKVMELLLPDRIKLLSKDDAAAATQLRRSLVGLVKLPTTRAGEDALVRVLQKMQPLLADGDRELKQELQRQLESLLNNNAYNKDYAEHFPALRIAAIGALADLGSQGSLDIIRSHVSAQPKLKIGDREIAANEPDAQVRFAALKALERLRDTQMRSYVADLIDKETDPTVASHLRDIRFLQQRLEPDSREYKEAYEAVLKELINPFNQAKYPYLRTFGEQATVDWLNHHFPLLNVDTFKDRAQDAVNNATSWWFRRTSWTETIENEEWKKAKGVHDQRWAEWNRLKELSLGTGEQADKARMALYYIMTSPKVNGMLGSQSGLNLNIRGYYRDDVTVHRFGNPDWQTLAARALLECSKTGCSSRDLTAHIVEMGLGYTSGLRTSGAGRHLLEAMKELAKPSNGRGEPQNFNVPREKLARIYAKALELELKRPQADQQEWYQAELVRELKALGHRMMFPVFQALSERSPFEKVKREAADTLTQMRDSVNLMWNETQADEASTAQDRATRLRAALEDRNNAEKTVQEIFNAYKGYEITEATDPGLPHLLVALNDNNERVKIAASKILMASKLPNNHPVKAKAIQTLANLVITGSAAGYRTDAYAELNKLEIDRPLHMMLQGGRLLKLERVSGRIQGTEFTGDKQTGFIYPTGGAFRFVTDAEGNLTEVWEDGNHYRRKQQDGRYIDQWERNTGTPTPWKGQIQVNADGTYWYQVEGSKDRWTRATNGTWTKTVVG